MPADQPQCHAGPCPDDPSSGWFSELSKKPWSHFIDGLERQSLFVILFIRSFMTILTHWKSDGHSYERINVEEWFAHSGREHFCALTREIHCQIARESKTHGFGDVLEGIWSFSAKLFRVSGNRSRSSRPLGRGRSLGVGLGAGGVQIPCVHRLPECSGRGITSGGPTSLLTLCGPH